MMFKRQHDPSSKFDEKTEEEKTAFLAKWEKSYDDKPVKPESIFISRNRPFHVFSVK